MGGSNKTTTQTHAETKPYAPTIPYLDAILGEIGGVPMGSANANPLQTPSGAVQPGGATVAGGGLLGNIDLTGNELSALDALGKNAQAGNPYLPALNALATDLFGGGTDRSGLASSAYDAYKTGLAPFARGDHADPTKDAAVMGWQDSITRRTMDELKGLYAGSGRDRPAPAIFRRRWDAGSARGWRRPMSRPARPGLASSWARSIRSMAPATRPPACCPLSTSRRLPIGRRRSRPVKFRN